MTLCCRWLGLAVVVTFLTSLAGCQHKPNAVSPLYVNLSYNGGACQQNGSSGVIDVEVGQQVIYQGATAINQFEVQFATCPFSSCPVNSPNGSPVNAGAPIAGTTGNTYYYSGLTIGNQQCNQMGSMGLRIKPGP